MRDAARQNPPNHPRDPTGSARWDSRRSHVARRLATWALVAAASACTNSAAPSATPDSLAADKDTTQTDTDTATGATTDSGATAADTWRDRTIDAGDAGDAGSDATSGDANAVPDDVIDDVIDGQTDAATTLDAGPDATANGNDATDAGDGITADTAPTDTSTPDTSTPDATPPDTSTLDTSTLDTTPTDTSTPDTSTPDAAFIDISTPDAGADSQAPLWPADAWSGPVGPVTQDKLPSAAFTDISGTYGLAADAKWAYCAAVGFIDGDDHPDAVFIEFEAPYGGGQSTVVRALLTGKSAKVVTSPFNTKLLYPDGGCALADLDGDGDGDLLVGGSSGLAYYAGDGKGGFTDVSAARLPAIIKAKVWSIAVDDFNGDGRLDIYLGAGKQPESCTGVTCGHTATDFICTYDKKQAADPFDDDRLLLQQVSGVFTDATQAWSAAKGGIATSVASVDLNGDGYPEVLVGNDFGDHLLLPNLGGKGFGKSVAAGFQPYAHAMGWGIGDLNGDGALDLVVADVGPLLVYAGKPGSPMGPWTQLPPGHPIGGATWYTSSWVPHVADLDHDGDLDIYLGVTLFYTGDMGKVMTDCTTSTDAFGAQDLVFINEGNFNFTIQTVAKGKCGRVAPLAQSLIDLDGDGDLDVVQVRADCGYGGGRLRFLRNDLKKAGGAVTVRLIGGKGNHDAIGATLTTTVGAAKVVRRVIGSVGIGSSGARTVHIGLGKALSTGPIVVTWPGGKVTQHAALKAGSTVTWKAP